MLRDQVPIKQDQLHSGTLIKAWEGAACQIPPVSASPVQAAHAHQECRTAAGKAGLQPRQLCHVQTNETLSFLRCLFQIFHSHVLPDTPGRPGTCRGSSRCCWSRLILGPPGQASQEYSETTNEPGFSKAEHTCFSFFLAGRYRVGSGRLLHSEAWEQVDFVLVM
ncbi:hypothetical protein MHYP_G00069860 [Metynnis hypsauchen]